MATIQSHIAQWKHNRDFVAAISSRFPDWIITATFYVAVHAVDAILSFDKIQITSHNARNDVLFKTNRYLAISKAYMPLYSLSRTMRYFADQTTWIPIASIEKEIFGRYLYPLEKSVQNLIGQDLQLGKIELMKDVAGR